MPDAVSFPKPLTPDEEKLYLQKYKSDFCKEAKDKLIVHNLRLVAMVVKKYHNHDREELISVGTVGLIKAVASFKPEKGFRLATYAIRCIENEILMFIRKAKKPFDISLQDVAKTDVDGNTITIEDMFIDEKANVEEQVMVVTQSEQLRQSMHILGERERAVIEMRYLQDMTQREIADVLNVSRSYISRIEKRALQKLNTELS